MQTQEEIAEAAHHLHLQVAIDGPAGAGKSTVGRDVAQALRCPYLDTGLMYRAVTLAAVSRGVSTESQETLAGLARTLCFTLEPDGLYVDGAPASPDLHSPAVDAVVSAVSAHPSVRRIMVEQQRGFADQQAIVMVGRDIGTVVLPDAPVKLWITASPAERARRRQREQRSVTGNNVAETLEARDHLDSSRAVSPLTKAEDAFDIDTDHLTPVEVTAIALGVVADTVSRLESCRHSDT